jgi:hypothetical protein
VPPSVVNRLLGLLTAALLGIDTYVHARDAHFYDAVRTSVISQGTLFRLEAAVAALIAVALLIRPSRFWWAAALIVAASAFGAVVLYQYVDVGRLGPLPNMYEPTWALPGKAASAWAEGGGIILAAAGLLTTRTTTDWPMAQSRVTQRVPLNPRDPDTTRATQRRDHA